MRRFVCLLLSSRVCWIRSTRQKRRSRVSYEHLLSGKYVSTHRASLSISAQVAAHIVVAPSAKQRSRVRSSGPVRDGETKTLNAPTFQANHMIMRIRCIVCTKSKASTKRVRYLSHCPHLVHGGRDEVECSASLLRRRFCRLLTCWPHPLFLLVRHPLGKGE